MPAFACARGLHLLLTPSIKFDDALTHAIVAGAALLFAYLAKAVSNLDPLTVDFSIFYVTARAWLEGQPMYGQISSSVQLVNYNQPDFIFSSCRSRFCREAWHLSHGQLSARRWHVRPSA